MSLIPKQRYQYIFGGVLLNTEMPLDGCLAYAGQARDMPSATIDYGHLPEQLNAPIKTTPIWQSTDSQLLYHYPLAGRYLVSHGESILIERDSEAADWNIQNALVRAPLGALLQQRGNLVLHASAVRVGDKGFIFMGRSAAGKSTLSAYMVHRMNCAFLSDEICSITFENNIAMIHSSSPEIRLFNDTKNWLKLTPKTTSQENPPPKNHIDQTDRAENQPLEIAAIYHLDEPIDMNSPTLITPIQKRLAMDVLQENTYRANFITGEKSVKAYFKGRAALVNTVPIFNFTRPKDFSKIDHSMQILQKHIHTLI